MIFLRRSLVECPSCSFPNSKSGCPTVAVTIEKTEQCALFVFHSTKLEMYVLVKTD